MRFFSIIALMLALADYFDLARAAEARVRFFMKFLWAKGTMLFRAGDSVASRVGHIAAALIILVAALAALLGKELPSGVRTLAELVIYIPLLLGMGMLALYGLLWLLTRPKQGVVATAGFAVVVIGLAIEIFGSR